jgi:hypothetical protein
MPPVLQVPPEQQPPLHGCEPEQVEVHWCFDVSHAFPVGQSLDELQPHAPATHWVPLVDILQSLQDAPVAPQVATSVPGLQVPPAQQPPLHGCDDEQVVVHWCAIVSQA